MGRNGSSRSLRYYRCLHYDTAPVLVGRTKGTGARVGLLSHHRAGSLRIVVFTSGTSDLPAVVSSFCQPDRSFECGPQRHSPRFLPRFRSASRGKDGHAKSKRNGAVDVQAAARICCLRFCQKNAKEIEASNIAVLEDVGNFSGGSQ